MHDYRDLGDRVPRVGALGDAWSSYRGVRTPKVGASGDAWSSFRKDAEKLIKGTTKNRVFPVGASLLAITVFHNQQIHEQARSFNRLDSDFRGLFNNID
jgi:hypothetical protein